MAVVAFASVSGSPGVTCAATAAAVHWPRPVLLVEADTASVGSLLTGFFRSNLDTDIGMQKVGLAYSRRALSASVLADEGFGVSIPVHALPPVPSAPIPALPDGHRMWVVPGFLDLRAVDGSAGMWHSLPAVFAELGGLGVDVLVDLGRLGRDDARLPLLDAAAQAVVVSGATMTDLNRLDKRLRLDDLADRSAGPGSDRFCLLLVDSPYEYVPPAAFARHALPVLGRIPRDPPGAAVFAHGRPDRSPRSNQYRRCMRRVVADLDERLSSSRDGGRKVPDGQLAL